ncbi:hypothetical protein B0H19DRAFT_1180847 [Mycena capillaripes]|nr:hypothetical protein B0H19DRAFT_1180847 [Mycena capillaripes]
MASTLTRNCFNFRPRIAGNLIRFYIGIAALTAAIWLTKYHTQCARLHFDDTRPPPKRPPEQRPPKDFEWKVPGDAHVHGLTLLDNIYLRNGTLYVISVDPPSEFPPLDRLLSQGVGSSEGDTERLRFITPEQARRINPNGAMRFFGELITRIEGVSVIVYDPPPLMKDFYHWFGEIILGAWRVYSHILISQPYDWRTQPPNHLLFPRRFILPLMDNKEQRDLAGKHGPLMRAIFPKAAIEPAGYWEDLRQLGTVVFDRVMLVNRAAAQTHPFARAWSNMLGGAMNVTAPAHFWAPVRSSLWEMMLPLHLNPDVGPSSAGKSRQQPLVTYISRQAYDRRLVQADHEALIVALRALEGSGICEVRVAVIEEMTLREQVELVVESTILVGVHGDGLTMGVFLLRFHSSWVI